MLIRLLFNMWECQSTFFSTVAFYLFWKLLTSNQLLVYIICSSSGFYIIVVWCQYIPSSLLSWPFKNLSNSFKMFQSFRVWHMYLPLFNSIWSFDILGKFTTEKRRTFFLRTFFLMLIFSLKGCEEEMKKKIWGC